MAPEGVPKIELVGVADVVVVAGDLNIEVDGVEVDAAPLNRLGEFVGPPKSEGVVLAKPELGAR